jgi:FkbM family methyltransferase
LALRTVTNVPALILDYPGLIHKKIEYGIKGTDIRIIARGGTPDIKEIIVVMSGYEYPLEILPNLKKVTLFDVGAHIGSFTLYAGNHYRNGECRLFSFEPDNGNFELLKENVTRNEFPGVFNSIHNCAVGSYNGIAKLDRSKENDGYFISPDPKGTYETCSMRTLPSLAEELGVDAIDILKLDVERSEYDILEDAPSLHFIETRVSYLILEQHYLSAEKNITWLKSLLGHTFENIFERKDVIFFRNRRLCGGGEKWQSPLHSGTQSVIRDGKRKSH